MGKRGQELKSLLAVQATELIEINGKNDDYRQGNLAHCTWKSPRSRCLCFVNGKWSTESWNKMEHRITLLVFSFFGDRLFVVEELISKGRMGKRLIRLV